MALPRIIYNSKNIDFTRGVADFTILPARTAIKNTSASGLLETLNIRSDFSVSILLRNFSNTDAIDADLKMQLFDAAQWADGGFAWFFAKDNTITVNTTLDSAVLAGATSIPVASATGVASGSRYVIESVDHAIVVEASNSATDPITITSGVDYGFASGSRLRAFEYLPMIGSIVVVENPPLFYNVQITGFVDKRAL